MRINKYLHDLMMFIIRSTFKAFSLDLHLADGSVPAFISNNYNLYAAIRPYNWYPVGILFAWYVNRKGELLFLTHCLIDLMATNHMR